MYMAQERRQYILRLLEQRGRIRSAQLAAELNVTDETIRTDLVALQKKGLLRRTHGGAEYCVPDLTANSEHNKQRADVAMAEAVAERIPAGSCLYADPCPFCRILAQALADKPCTFLTCSPQFALHLAPKALPHELLCCGGRLNKDAKLFDERAAESFLRANRPHFAVLRPQALTATHAAYYSAPQAHWAAAAAQYAQECIIAIPAASLYTNAQHSFTLPPFHLITEDNLPPGFSAKSIRTIPYISAELFTTGDDFVF
ncbi:MAG: DeoR/GlpR transcriptional regulator [Akkermansiaceae bacterium]|nr:DeoR/GlpR transcriptional regulator [Akkermansiaceae bacterium]